MSLITAFPFHAYVGDLKTRHVMPEKMAVSLSLLSPHDMSNMAFVEVRTRCGQEEKTAPWRPVMRAGEEHATFYDPRMGNFDVRTYPPQSCQTCAASLTGKYGNERCQGHFGFVGMPRLFPGNPLQSEVRMFVMNPHLVEEAELLLQAKCFFCHKFRAPLFDVERYRQTLRLIDCGLIGEALHLLDVVTNAKGNDARHKRLHVANEEVVNDVSLLEEHVERILRRYGLTSTEKHPTTTTTTTTTMLTTTEEIGGETTNNNNNNNNNKGAIDVRNNIARQALRDLREYPNVCSHCNGLSPRITKRNGHFFFFFKKNSANVNVANALLSQAQLREWEENNKLHKRSHTYFRNQDIREHLKQLCHKEDSMLSLLFPHLGEPSVSTSHSTPLPGREMYKVFFIDRILVPPLPLRLSSGVQVQDSGAISPDTQTRALSDVLGFVEQIECYQMLRNNSTPDRNLVSTAQEIANEINLRNLQVKVNEVYQGILESFAKKEGLFRMNMMGKRVNQACRSVISPDPLVEPNEVLLPRPFSRSLSFPEQVTCFAPARMNLLKRCVINGPQRYPGATHLELRHANGEIRFVDLNVPEQTRRQHAAKYFAMAQSGMTLIVYRHILDGDRVVFNRQPTLHKPSMMGYRVKVLSGYKTLRFHYVNGSSFNADFDGDEMNIHVPQSLEAKAELDTLMDANLNYLVPTSGKPIRGLIQDHVAAGVMLTLRDKFLDHATFVQLVYYGLAPYMQQQHEVTLSELIPVPAILRPRPLWTGKQLISVIIRFVSGVGGRSRSTTRGGESGVTLKGTSLIQPTAYNTTIPGSDEIRTFTRRAMDDDSVFFMNSELLIGLMCKKQLGASSMSIAHVVHELYGPHKVGQLFGALGRILSQSLQREGFSIGMDDMFLVQEQRRYELLRQLDEAPLQLPDDEAIAMPKIMEYATKLQQEFMPGRMMVPFPRNHLLMMTTSGAKGSNANATQMALGLGQQLFDGRRVKRMNSAKTLPAFFPHERRARSFGYAIGRFASGIRPPEYTIHAMAGRDGLIDTAVKTSRSGHLQRCLIKGLESLIVHWDHSVRDSNGSVVQFTYGGDGLDPCKASTLQAWEMAKENVVDLGKRFGVDVGATTAEEQQEKEKIQRGKRPRADEEEVVSTHTTTITTTTATTGEDKAQVRQQHLEQQVQENPLPRYMQDGMEEYLRNKATFPLFHKVSQVARWSAQNRLKEKLAEKREENVEYYRDVLTELTTNKRLRAFCDPGEPVGLLAAQAAGEPSTQMTLNTFHSAGSTVTHVTEGIPRLRELLIHASVQNAAVVVPVENATDEDEVAIARLLRAAVPTKLIDCLARGTNNDNNNNNDGDSKNPNGDNGPNNSRVRNAGKGWHYHVARQRDATVLTIALLFSQSHLDESRDCMCMSPSEHLESFTEALRQFAKRVVKVLRGRTREEKDTAGATGEDITDGTDVMIKPRDFTDAAGGVGNDDGSSVGDHGGDALSDSVSEADEDDDDDDGKSSGKCTGSVRGARTSPALRSQQGGADPLDGFENEEEEADTDDEEDNVVVHKDNKNEEDEDEEDMNMNEKKNVAGKSSSRVNYRTFLPLRASYGGHAFTVDISPLSLTAARRDGVALSSLKPNPNPNNNNNNNKNKKNNINNNNNHHHHHAHADKEDNVNDDDEDLFVVNVVLRLPPGVVAVVPDVVAAALLSQSLPSSLLPPFEAVAFTRNANNRRCGELVFTGAGATVRRVLAFLSLFTINIKSSLNRSHSNPMETGEKEKRGGVLRSVKVRKARSTDIREMAYAFGIEAAYRALYDELRKLFGRYSVDHRHLTLIADAATHRGVWENFNFTGVIARSASPLFQMTFASSRRWLHTAVTRGMCDELQSISAAIMVGERPRVGTASVGVTPDAAVLRDVLERGGV
ncbi:putative DNA-directed rna polymerase I largest subunit [Trypanosoma theileri]|uniref:DNA-directed RNA polymerase I subunit RPA1 n=1 Tax=Trypanosoma theileri TaxID=67003 RepID=A0A1X0NZF6_9TRYP|nr:putative DNA-directed rna polymerase I largest subunit [Trypanosoma theileri]ORC89873.1 putative DNA-directed rna polymerase I largest subunit [Trypanosoma theileri]